MSILRTYAEVESELAETAGYRAGGGNVALAERRETALRRKLDFAEQSDEAGRSISFDHSVVLKQLQEVEDWVNANSGRTASVVHADFSTFGKYEQGGGRGGYCP